MPFRSSLTRTQGVFAVLVSIAGMVPFLLATSTYGMGVSSDSMNYIAAADSFARGEGFFDYRGLPLVWWPPGVSFLLGMIRRVFGMPPLLSARLIHAVVISLVILCAALIFARCFPRRPVWFYTGALATLFSLTLYSAGSNVGSDLLFYLFVLLFFLVSQNYLSRQSISSLVLLGLIAACAALLRYVGAVLSLVGIVILLVEYRKEPRRAAVSSLVYGILSLLPISLWVLLRNYYYFHTFTGPRIRSQYIFSGNALFTYLKISQWFLPARITDQIPAFLFLVVTLLLLLAFNKRQDWLRWVRRLVSAPILPLAVFSVLYGLTISFTVVTEDHFDYYDDRYQWPLFIPFLVFFFLTIEELVLPHIKPARRKLADWLIFTAFILWAVYPLTLISKFVSKSLENGVVAYNMYNTRTVRQSPLVSLIMQYPLDQAIPIYTNYPALIYFLMERRSLPSPFDPVNFPRSQQYLLDNYQGWPGAEKAYDIYFITNDRRHYFSPWELKKVSRIEKIGEHADGGLYLASPK